MKSLQRLILGSFFAPFVASTIIVTFLFVVQHILKYIEDLTSGGVGIFPILELMFYFSFNMIPRVMPLSILISSLILFGNLGQHNELTAIKSAGISLLRILQPVFLFVCLLTYGTYLFSNYVLPRTNLKAYSLLYDITEAKVFEIPEGRFYGGLDNFRIKVDKNDTETGRLYGITIYNHGNDGGMTLADSGRLYKILEDQYAVLELYHGAEYRKTNMGASDQNPEEYKNGMLRTNFEKSKLVINIKQFGFKETPQESFSNHRYMKSVEQLKESIDSLNKEIQGMKNNIRQNLSNSYFSYHFKGDSIHQLTSNDTKVAMDTIKDEYLKKEILKKSLDQARGFKQAVDSYHDRLRHVKGERNRDEVVMYYKYTHPFACLVMFLIGAPIGAIIKKGGLGIPSLVTIVFFIIYYILHMTGEKYAKEGVYPVVPSMWAANVILLPIGLFFLWQARNDSRLFEVPVWMKNTFDYFKNIFSRKKK